MNQTSQITTYEDFIAAYPEGVEIPISVRDRPFYAYRYAKSPEAKAVINYVVDAMLEAEDQQFIRQRKRQPLAFAKFKLQVEALVCDLLHHDLSTPCGWLSVSLSKTTLCNINDRYMSDIMGSTFPDVIKLLANIGYVEFCKGYRNPFDRSMSRQSTIRVGRELEQLSFDHELSLMDFGHHKSEECIVLKSPKRDLFDKGDWLQYEDTDEIDEMRGEIHAINDWLSRADICYTDEESATWTDSNDRFLRRYFNNASFEQGGRLFGGFWQYMSKQDRQEYLQIEGEDVVTLDYGQMVPRILYGIARQDIHFEDAYTIPGLEDYRDGVKKVFNAMLHSEKPLQMKPRETAKLLPKGMTIEEITSKIIDFHAPVASYFYAKKGLYLSFLESEILIAVLIELMNLNIIALPIHDAVIVKECESELTKNVMENVFYEKTGTEALVNFEYVGM